MKTALINGKIYQGKSQFTTALFIDGNVITACGEQVDTQQADKIIDLNGKTVIAGFNDCHLHLSYYAENRLRVQIEDCTTVDQIYQRCREFKAAHPNCKGLMGRGYNEDHFTDGRSFSKQDLNDISNEIPITLTRICGHSCICNDVALKMLGVESEDGYLYETDCDRTKVLYPYEREELKQAIIDAMDEAISLGITSIQSQDIDDFENNEEIISLLEEIFEKDEKYLRWYLQAQFNSIESFKRVVGSGCYKLNTQSKKLSLGPLKLFKDGSLGAKTAYLHQGYVDEKNNTGIEVITPEQMDEYVRFAQENHIQVFTHAIGDRAVDEVIDCYKKWMDKNNSLRHCINHCQITTNDTLKEIAKNFIPVAYQPVFLEYDLHMVEKRVAKELAYSSYAYKTALDLGIVCGYSTDCPVEPFNPFWNIHCAVNRQDFNFIPENGYNPIEKLNVEQAIDGYTIGSSYIQHQEKNKGLLKEGYLADLVILDQDIFTVDSSIIKDIRPIGTMIDGIIIYKR